MWGRLAGISGLAFGLALAGGMVAPAQAQVQSSAFNIQPGTLKAALDSWARQSGRQVIYRLHEVGAIRSRGSKGASSADAALQSILSGTGFSAKYDPSGAIAIVRESSALTRTGQSDPGDNTDQAAAGASADTTETEASAGETIVVTGSLIRREKSSQLVTAVDSEELRLRGATNAVDMLAAVAQNQSIDTSATSATFGGLTNLANLRALGSENTLVLFNGKRIVRNPLRDNGVDLNTVPTALIDSVDVLADGASSIYGTDAVAGVINFRTKEEVRGLQYYGYTLQPEARGGETYAGSLSFGAGSLREAGWNFFVGGSVRERKPISSRDRSFSNTSVIADRDVNFLLRQSFPANLTQLDAAGNVIINNANPYPCTPPATVPFRGACGLDADAAGFIDIQNPEKQYSAVVRVAGMLGEHKASLEYIWGRSSITSALTPTTFFDVVVPNSSPFYPGNGNVPTVAGLDPTLPILINSRFTPAGRRTTENLTTTDRLLAQVEGQVARFDYELWALRSISKAKLKSRQGAVLLAEAEDGFAGRNGAPFLNPFGPQTAAGEAYLESIQVRDTLVGATGRLSMAGVTVTDRSLFELPGGSAAAALAFEYGSEKARYNRNPITNRLEGAVVGGDQESSGGRDRWSVTGEMILPLADQLEANASARYDRYSDFGGTFNPKLLLRFAPSRFFDIHASANTGFRAPTLYNLFTPNTLSFVRATTFDDPVLCPNGVVNTAAGGVSVRDCDQLYNTLLGGNRDLQPEKSVAFAVGTAVRVPEQAIPGSLRFGLDYWSYRLKNRIGALVPAAIFADPVRFSGLVVRCSDADPTLRSSSSTCSFPAGGNPIAYVVQTNTNLGKTRTSGVDFLADWSLDSSIGRIGIEYRGTYVLNYKYQRIPEEEFFSRRGRHFDGFPVIPYSHYATLSWGSGPISAQLQNRVRGGYTDCNAQCFIGPDFFNKVDTYSLWNLAATYEFSDALSITGHISNILDTNPPFSNTDTTLCTGCDTRFADPTGRAFGVTVRGRFDRLLGL
jgi:iron complex outermembrane receptor protein